jgi:transaldolase
MNSLEGLKALTTVVADSGDFETARKYRPQDATTNPSLILSAAKLSAYSNLIDNAIEYAQRHSSSSKSAEALDKLLVNFGTEYLKIIPGRVSTEVDARLSYDTDATVAKARKLISMYEENGIDRTRILIKIAATWEGIQAVRILEEEGIHCNVTLLFSLVQAAAAATAGATLISPFVGRITDWYNRRGDELEVDPGVSSVKNIYAYLQKHNYKTIVMGASFRSTKQILQLAGIDLLTISPALLEQLEGMDASVTRTIDVGVEKETVKDVIHVNQATFQSELAKDPMASDLLADGIKRFDHDAQSLEALLEGKLSHIK